MSVRTPDELDALLQWLVNRVKELKSDVRKMKKEMKDDDERINRLSGILIKIVQRQKELEERLDQLEDKQNQMDST